MTSRVVYVITDSGIGGSEKILTDLLENLDRNRFNPAKVIILKNKRESAKTWEEKGIPVVSLGMRNLPFWSHLVSLKREMVGAAPDLIHAFLYHAVQSVRLVTGFLPNARFVSSPRVNYRFAPPWARLFDRALRKKGEHAIAESSTTKATLVESLRYDPDKVHVVLNGVDADLFTFNENFRQFVRKDLNIAPTDILIGAVGRLHHQKGFDLLIEAVRLIASQHKFKVIIIGKGPEEKRLKDLSRGLPIIFLGERTDLPRLYSGMDFFIQSSRYEGLSNALLEAMSSGRPIVATAVDGTLDVVQDHVNAVLAKPAAGDLAEKLKELIMNRDLQVRLGISARQTALNFSKDKMILGFQAVYDSILSIPQTVANSPQINDNEVS